MKSKEFTVDDVTYKLNLFPVNGAVGVHRRELETTIISSKDGVTTIEIEGMLYRVDDDQVDALIERKRAKKEKEAAETAAFLADKDAVADGADLQRRAELGHKDAISEMYDPDAGSEDECCG